ncbi:MAG: hypothetical protein DSZ05_09055, partial [Sulfurospirillum sp.]
MKLLFRFLLLSLFFVTYAQACDSSMSESHVQNCENHTVDVENHDAVCCTMPIPIADYHFDRCIWDGTAGEVIDSSGNDLNATDVNGTTLTDGKI